MLIHVFHSGAIPGSTGYFGYTLKRVPSDLPTMQTGPWRKFGGPIEVMPGERRAGITEDVLAEIGYRGFSMREHMVTVAQRLVRHRLTSHRPAMSRPTTAPRTAANPGSRFRLFATPVMRSNRSVTTVRHV